ncbi:MAG: chemotaxis protein CheC, partial [Clostridia bacterium]|nr:chemotaxis protein CheC [Clostridia bacterium]
MGVSDFNDMELDAIGEIMNISLGASATAVSTMLGTKVNITTPVVRVLTSAEFEFKSLEPAVGVEIAYTEGLEGSNIMMFRRNDMRIIVGMLMGAEIPDEEFEMNEINVSAICEVMNQMMGSSATALSEFLGNPVNISTPVSFPIESENGFKEKYFTPDVKMVVVRFSLEIEGKLESEFLNIMSSKLAKHLLEPFAISFQQAEQYQMEEDARKRAEEVHEEPPREAPADAPGAAGEEAAKEDAAGEEADMPQPPIGQPSQAETQPVPEPVQTQPQCAPPPSPELVPAPPQYAPQAPQPPDAPPMGQPV